MCICVWLWPGVVILLGQFCFDTGKSSGGKFAHYTLSVVGTFMVCVGRDLQEMRQNDFSRRKIQSPVNVSAPE